MKRVFGFLLTIAFAVPSNAQNFAPKPERLQTACVQKTGWVYCVSRTEESTNPDVIYYLHPYNNDENSWVTRAFNKQIRETWENIGYAAPTVVTVSFGTSWWLSEKTASKESGKYEMMTDDIFPTIEAEIGKSPAGRRQLIGESMGGFNALQLLLKEPESFARSAVLCPLVLTINPYSSSKEVRDFVKRTGANGIAVNVMLNILRGTFPTVAAWDSSAALPLSDYLMGPHTPPFYLSVGDDDELGFHEGTALLAEAAKQKGVEVQWQLIKGGGHCSGDAAELAKFIARE